MRLSTKTSPSEISAKHYTKKIKMGQVLFFKAFFPLTAGFLSAIEYHKILCGEERSRCK
jgi:hypothetical protein